MAADGVDWGDSAIQEYLADQAVGSTIVDYRIPNRTIRLPLRLRSVTGTTFATIRTNLQAKVALIQREGGALARTIGATTLYADVVNATLHLGGSLLQAIRSFDVDAWLELECVPDWYGDEVTLSDHVETTNPSLIFTEATVNGNYPGRVRLIVDNDQATDQHGLIWGFRCKNYDAAGSAALFIQAESMTLVNGTTSAALSGSSGGNAARIQNLPPAVWVSMVSTTLSSGPTPLTHKGTYRVWARVYSDDPATSFRFQWANGSLAVPITNAAQSVPGASAFYALDMGTVRLDAPAVGSNQWVGVFQAQVGAATTNTYIDCVWFQPLDEGAGVLTYTPVAPLSAIASGKGAVTGVSTVAEVNGPGSNSPWTNVAWAQDLNGYGAQNTLQTGQATKYLQWTNFGFAIPAAATVVGAMFRAFIRWEWDATPSIASVPHLVKAGSIQAGNPTQVGAWVPWGSDFYQPWGGASDLWGGTLTPTDVNNTGFGAALYFSCTYAPGYFNVWVDYVDLYVYYTLAGGFSIAQDAVIYASSTAELRTEGMLRKGSGSSIYGPVSNVVGDLPRIPPSALEGRTVQVLLKGSRGNFANEADAGIDDISCQIKYRPSHLYTT